MSTLREFAAAAEIATPEQIAELYRAIEIPQAPVVRQLEDELGPIPPYRQTVERIAGGVAIAALACGLFLP